MILIIIWVALIIYFYHAIYINTNMSKVDIIKIRVLKKQKNNPKHNQRHPPKMTPKLTDKEFVDRLQLCSIPNDSDLKTLETTHYLISSILPLEKKASHESIDAYNCSIY